jgi:hypothetical protein
VRIPIDHLEIPAGKITQYLLVSKEKNDKSAFLANLGYTINNWGDLVNDIKQLININEAHLQQTTAFGNIYEVKGQLKNLAVVTIWLLATDAENYRFITLFPDK